MKISKTESRLNLWKEWGNDFILGILGGVSISLGGLAYLLAGGGVVGSLFFVVGLFIVLTFNFNLYTGKVCYVLDNDKKFLGTTAITWVGNFIGALFVGYILQGTRLLQNADVQSLITNVANTKLADTWYSVFILAIFCNIMIYVAVDGFKNNKHQIGKYLSLFFGVSVFVLCGFEHSIADMFYFSFADAWSWKAIGWILIITVGNAVGGLIIPVAKKIINKNTPQAVSVSIKEKETEEKIEARQ